MERMGELAGRAQLGVFASGGYTLLVKLLEVDDWGGADMREVRREAAAILRELCFSDRAFAGALASRPGFAERLVALCAADGALLESLVALLEEVLPAMPRTLPADAALLDGLLRASPSSHHLVVLTRLLSLFLFENAPPGDDAPGFGVAPDAPRYVRDNAAALLATDGPAPGLLPRLVALLRTARVPSSARAARILAHPATQLLLARMPHIAHAVLPMLETLAAGGEVPPGEEIADAEALEEGPWGGGRPNHRTDILALLCALLTGPCKVEAQDKLGAADFVAAAEVVFASIDWDTPAPEPHEPGVHGPGCQCNTVAALRIGLLRTLHAFMEREADNGEGLRGGANACPPA